MTTGLLDEQTGNLRERGLIPGQRDRHRRHSRALLVRSHGHDPFRPRPTGRGRSDHAAYTKFLTDPHMGDRRGTDGTAWQWDATTAEAIGDPIVGDTTSLLGADDQPIALADTTGSHVPTVTTHGLQLWNLDPATWPAVACQRAGRNLTETEWKRFLPAAEPHHKTARADRFTGARRRGAGRHDAPTVSERTLVLSPHERTRRPFEQRHSGCPSARCMGQQRSAAGPWGRNGVRHVPQHRGGNRRQHVR